MADNDSTTVEEGGKEKTDKGEVTEVKDNVGRHNLLDASAPIGS